MQNHRPLIPHLPALDGLRGLAVAGVLAFHAGLGWAGGGFLGVSAFFTLSGFLITSLLLAEHAGTGRIALGHFWARRARRLLPASFVALAGVVVFGLTTATPDQLQGLRADALAALGYVANWRFVLDGQSYADLFSEPSPVQHFWSLAIEEQFYVAFPLLAAILLRRGRSSRRTVLAFAAVISALAAGSVALMVATAGGDDPMRAYYGTDTRAAELLVGALLAVALAQRPGWWRPERATHLLPAVSTVAFALVVGSWTLVDEGDGWLYRGGFALHAVAVAAVIAGAAGPGPVRALLSTRPLRGLGRISYGLYLYHWPIFLWLDAGTTGLDGPALLGLRLAVTLAAAVVSYHLVEEPIRQGRAVVAWRSWALPPVAATAVAAAVVASTVQLPEPELVFEAVSATPPTVELQTSASLSSDAMAIRLSDAAERMSAATVPPVPVRPARILVVGDSVAQTLGRGFERWGARTGEAEVWNAGREYCGLFRGGGVSWDGAPSREDAHCDRVQREWGEQAALFDPDYVIVLSTIWDQVPRHLPEWGETLLPGDPRYDAHLTSSYLAAIDDFAARGAVVALFDPPCHLRDAQAHGRVRDLRRRLLPELKRARPDTLRLIGLHGVLCAGESFEANQGHLEELRPDGLHFSDAGADWVADRLASVILKLPRRPDAPSAS